MDTKQSDNSLETLESPSTTQVISAGSESPSSAPQSLKPSSGGLFKKLSSRSSLYLLGFGLVIVLAGAVIIVIILNSNKAADKAKTNLTTQKLDDKTLDQLKSTDVTLGDPKQILAVQSNAIFAGKVLVKGSLDVAGGVNIGNALTLPGITVSGTSSFNQIQANELAISGSTTIQGTLSLQKNLNVTGNASFGGTVSAPQIAIDSLILNKDIQLNRHIDAGGSVPTKSDGSALGSGGTTSISGTDTAGTLTINLGSNPGAGCFATITFSQKFSATPHIAITPVGSDAASLTYYVNRTTTNFSICSTTAGGAGKTFSFDYIAID